MRAAAVPSTSVTKGFFICFVGIFFSYLLFGIYQEKINKSSYGENSSKFKCTYCLVLCQCIFNCLWSYIACKLINSKDTNLLMDKTQKYYYIMCAISYSTAMIASNSALKHVSYPTQVIGKSIKPIPILFMTWILGNANYTIYKYLNVFMITAGVTMFMYKNQSKIVHKNHYSNPTNILFLGGGIGELLLILSLLMDGITASLQSKMKNKFQTKAYPMMYYLNFFSSILIFSLVLYNNEIYDFIIFCEHHPKFLLDLLCFCATSALGQNFIFYTVTTIGPLSCSIITTTRKFFTVLMSVILFRNHLENYQWIGVIMVFVGLGFDAYCDKTKKSIKKID